MHVSSLHLTNIRCFENAEFIFSPQISLLVGENNAGKTTAIYALMALQRQRLQIESVRFGAQNASIRISFEAISAGAFAHPIRNLVATQEGRQATYEASWRVNPDGGSTPLLILASGENISFHPFPDVRPDNYLVMYLADRRTAGFNDAVGTGVSRTPGGNLQNVYAKIDECVTSAQLRPLFNKACEQVLGLTISAWQSSNSGKVAGLEVDAIRYQHIPLDRMGAGVANCIGLIVELLVSRHKLFLVEEPESELHPTALRALLNLIVDSACDNGNQFIISTHSNIVVRHLGGMKDTVINEVQRVHDTNPPKSIVRRVGSDARSRIDLLASLGYEFSDFELFSGWLILEESSAEAIIREFLLKWFAPKLVGNLCTIAAGGAQDVEPRFVEFARIFTFIHKESAYKNRAWVVCDGDQAGLDAVTKLQNNFKDWPKETFLNFGANAFEYYYPVHFSAEVSRVLGLADKQKKRAGKKALVESVKVWPRENEEEGQKQLQVTAAPVINILQDIETQMMVPVVRP